MIKIALVDDERSYLDTLEEYLGRYQEEHHEFFEITKYQDGDEILSHFHCQFDLIFLDIQMNFLNGMSTAEEIRKLDSRVIIMFITNRTDFAVRGYEVDALDYILKPVSYFEFSKKLERALKRMEKKSELMLAVTISAGLKRVDAGEILYIESEGHYLIFHTRMETFKTRAKIADYETELKEHGFVRINKGCLLNLKYAEGVEENCAVVAGERLPVSRSRKQEFMASLAAYISQLHG